MRMTAVEIQNRMAVLGVFGADVLCRISVPHTKRVLTFCYRLYRFFTLTRIGARTTVSAGGKASLLTLQDTGFGGIMKNKETRQSMDNPASV